MRIEFRIDGENLVLTDENPKPFPKQSVMDPSTLIKQPVLMVAGEALSPRDAIISGYRYLEPSGGITSENQRFINSFWSQAEGVRWCRRCGYGWRLAGFYDPKNCPGCGSAKWKGVRQTNEPGPRRQINVLPAKHR